MWGSVSHPTQTDLVFIELENNGSHGFMTLDNMSRLQTMQEGCYIF